MVIMYYSIPFSYNIHTCLSVYFYVVLAKYQSFDRITVIQIFSEINIRNMFISELPQVSAYRHLICQCMVINIIPLLNRFAQNCLLKSFSCYCLTCAHFTFQASSAGMFILSCQHDHKEPSYRNLIKFFWGSVNNSILFSKKYPLGC